MIALAVHAVIDRQALLRAGVTKDEIDHAVATRRLLFLHRGVYAIAGAPLTVHSYWRAATLATDSVLAARDAAAFRGVRSSSRARIDVIAKTDRERARIDVRVLRLFDDEWEEVDGIRVTGLHRTFIDLAALVSVRETELAMERAVRSELTDSIPLRTVLERHPRHPGTKIVARFLDSGRLGKTFTRSGFEEAFIPYLDAHRLEHPEFNARILEGEVDALWREQRVAVELDSREFHDNPVSFAEDRLKSRRLSVARLHPVRVAPEHLDTSELAHDLVRLGVRVVGTAPT